MKIGMNVDGDMADGWRVLVWGSCVRSELCEHCYHFYHVTIGRREGRREKMGMKV